jgi:prophage DNA circulation protein
MKSTTRALGARLGLVAIVGGFCSACSTIQSITPSASQLASLVSFNSTSPSNQDAGSAQQAVVAGQEIDCPQVEVQDGTAAIRVGGQDNQSVRYQFEVTQTARECKVEGAQFAIKVGVAGRLLIGPAGSAGSYSAPLRIVVRNDVTSKPVISKLYKIDAAADAASNLQAPFQVVSEPFLLPYEHKWADQDYTILVGFDTGKQPAEEKRQHKKRTN